MSLTYRDLRRFFEIALPFAFDMRSMPKEIHPLTLLDEREAAGESQASKALALALNDVLGQLSTESQTTLDSLSKDLELADAPSLFIMKAWSDRRIGAILGRGVIKDEQEFETMTSMLDQAQLSPSERDKIQAMVDQFEFGGRSQ